MNAMHREEFDAKSARTRQPLPLWAGAFDRATLEHSPEVIGAYMLILMAMWETKSCDLPADDKLLARVTRVSPTIWRRKLAPLILPMLSEKNSRIFSKKLQENAEKTEEYCRKQHERKLGKNSPKLLKGKEQASTADTSTEQSAEPTGENPKPLTINSKKEEEGACAREAESFSLLRSAVGLDPSAPLSRYWQDEAVEPWVTRWRKVGLTDDQILAEAKASRAKNPEPPEGPKALNAWMMQAATNRTSASSPVPEGAKAQAPKVPMSPEKRLEFWAEKINGPDYVPNTAVSSSMRNALIASGMVTEARLRERGL